MSAESIKIDLTATTEENRTKLRKLFREKKKPQCAHLQFRRIAKKSNLVRCLNESCRKVCYKSFDKEV